MIFLPRMIVVHAVGIKLGLELLARLASWLHQVFASTQGLLSLPLCGAVRLPHPFFVTTISGLLTTCIRITRLCRILREKKQEILIIGAGKHLLFFLISAFIRHRITMYVCATYYT